MRRAMWCFRRRMWYSQTCDLLFVSKERSHIINEDNIRGAPDLVIEILSPSTAQRGRTLKRTRTLYALRGVPEYWQADTDAKIAMVHDAGRRRI